MAKDNCHEIHYFKERRKWVLSIKLLLAILLLFFGGFVCGNASNKSKIEEAKKEAETKVEEAEKEANSKVELLEKRIKESYTTDWYAMLEAFYDMVCKLRKNEPVIMAEVERTTKWNEIELPYLSWNDKIDETVILEHIDALEEIAEKYPLSSLVNKQIIWIKFTKFT